MNDIGHLITTCTWYIQCRKLTGDGISFLTSWSDVITGDRLWSCFTWELTWTLCSDRFTLSFCFTCLDGLSKDLNVMTQQKKRSVHTRGLVSATSPLKSWDEGNGRKDFSQKFKCVWIHSVVPTTRFWSKNGQFTGWDLSPQLVAGSRD